MAKLEQGLVFVGIFMFTKESLSLRCGLPEPSTSSTADTSESTKEVERCSILGLNPVSTS